MPTPLTDADKVIRNDTGISIANAITALSGVVRGGNENIGDAYNSSNSYSAGDYCIYENTLYKCTGATSGAWDSNKWTETSIADEINAKADASTTYTKTEVDTGLLGGCRVEIKVLGGNSTIKSPEYTELCTVIVGRGIYGMGVGANNGYQNLVAPSGLTITKDSGIGRLTLQNTISTTCVCMFIYK